MKKGLFWVSCGEMSTMEDLARQSRNQNSFHHGGAEYAELGESFDQNSSLRVLSASAVLYPKGS